LVKVACSGAASRNGFAQKWHNLTLRIVRTTKAPRTAQFANFNFPPNSTATHNFIAIVRACAPVILATGSTPAPPACVRKTQRPWKNSNSKTSSQPPSQHPLPSGNPSPPKTSPPSPLCALPNPNHHPPKSNQIPRLSSPSDSSTSPPSCDVYSHPSRPSRVFTGVLGICITYVQSGITIDGNLKIRGLGRMKIEG
jgi:hypothetical protein